MTPGDPLTDTEIVDFINRALSLTTVNIATNPGVQAQYLSEFAMTANDLLARRISDPIGCAKDDSGMTCDCLDVRECGSAYPKQSDTDARIERIRALVATWAVDADTYLHLDGPDLGYADAAVQITAIIDNPT